MLLHFKNNEGTWVKKKYGHFVKISTEDWGINNLIFWITYSKSFMTLSTGEALSRKPNNGFDEILRTPKSPAAIAQKIPRL